MNDYPELPKSLIALLQQRYGNPQVTPATPLSKVYYDAGAKSVVDDLTSVFNWQQANLLNNNVSS